MVTVNGATGPFNSSKPSGYGANAAKNYQNLLVKDPVSAFTADIKYSPDKTKAGIGKAALGYAREDIKQFDINGDKRLDQTEITGIFGDESVSKNFLTALDRNKDGFVSRSENAAFIIFQDKLDNAANGSNAADGLIKPESVTQATVGILSEPEVMNAKLQEIRKEFIFPLWKTQQNA
ncbi:MAG: hypothetical protein VKJ06_07390 [Vampirovibrionales bacterium]|nr:hypothetical protein [Vampirovibrionales bacterium]